jgi:hypothetical protein
MWDPQTLSTNIQNLDVRDSCTPASAHNKEMLNSRSTMMVNAQSTSTVVSLYHLNK